MGLSPENCCCLIIDIQEKLFGRVHQSQELLERLKVLYEACLLLKIPTILSEQYPQGLGSTVEPLQSIQPRFEKTAFSCVGDPAIKKAILDYPQTNWIIAGIESHVCVLQTARDLLQLHKGVIVPVDCISSRHILDHEMAIRTLGTLGAKVSSCETLLFDLLGDAKHPQFKAISRLIK